MHRDRDDGHFIAAANRTMAVRTVERGVFRMTEADVRVADGNRDPVRRSGLMTGRARADISFPDDLVLGVTLETGRMRISAVRNRHPASALTVTRRTASFFEMRGVIEIRAKTRHLRESLEFRRLRSGMTRRTNRMSVVFKLLSVTARAGRVRRKFGARLALVADMAHQTGNAAVTAVVIELGKIDVVHRVGRGKIFRQRFERAFGFRFFLNVA